MRVKVKSFLRLIAVSRIAMFGAALTTSAFIGDVLLTIGELFFFESHPYIGIVVYLVLPSLFVLGLLTILVGIVLRIRSSGEPFSLSGLERLAERRRIHLVRAGQVILVLSLVNLVIFALVSYRGYHFTESVTFCGQLCHEVMHPEFETYSRSPHSQIACVECHIGSGADWFVKSKISGARQLLAVAFDTYSRPIETPVHNLRPARDVCEVCHRPDIFHGNLVKVLEHYEPDEENTRTFTVLNMRVGGGGGDRGPHGIHWHVSRDHEVRYYATDRKRENIVWVEQRNEDGTRRVWTDPTNPVEPGPDAEVRLMDCVDCHNRPTHIYLGPEEALDEWMSTERLDAGIPWLRSIAHEVLTRAYETTEEAMDGIAGLPALYAERYPEHWAAHEAGVRAMVPELQEIHRSFVFPQMNIGWNTYNSRIGHATPHTQACFRCHNGILRDPGGEPITLDCKACHFILANREVNPRILDRLERR
jgi:hypothetical protein